jgi:4-amino-4-deoxy-L-arabinose transferase-like glycosyltransferase
MDNNQFWKLLVAIAGVYLTGTFVNVMDIDAAQYASISREMLETGRYLQVYEHGQDYLDKPPLLFWLSSLSMGVFGATNFGYKFPSLLFAFLAIYSTYRFAKVFYSETIARLAALVLASSQALFIMTNDVRTDTILMGCVAFTFWHLAEAFENNNWKSFLLGFIGIGLGLLAKGPVALLMPALAFSAHFIYKKQYKNFLRLEYLWGLVVIALILLPMCIGLYQQFDMYPEKVVNGKTGVSGLRFFFWVQSFGRITGENAWRNGVYFTYLFQTMFWSFAPWILIFIVAYLTNIVNIFKKDRFFETKELITLGGFTLGYISLAVSKYQLPHYIFVVYPLISVITARFIVEVLGEKLEGMLGKTAQILSRPVVIMIKALRGVHWFVISILWLLPFLISIFTFPFGEFDFMFFFNPSVIVMVVFFVLYLVSAFQYKQLVLSSINTVVAINLFLNLSFYRNLLRYQESSEVGKKVRNIPADQFFTYKYPNMSALHFYSRRIVQVKDDVAQVKTGDWLLLNETGLGELQEEGLNVKIIETGNTFSVTNLTPTFLNAETRPDVVGQYFLVQILEGDGNSE